MEIILDQLEKQDNWKELMRSSCRQNGLNTSLAADLTILKLRQLDQRFKKSSVEKMNTSWMENELKAYNWLLVAVSALSQVLIKDFGEEQWVTLKKAFLYKEKTFLRFEARKLIEGKISKNRWWSDLEEQMLLREAAHRETDSINWNEIAHRMFENSQGKIFRSGKHCREHWLNHLDPHKQRGAWGVEEDLFLLQNVAEGGKKWSQYASILKRTEHMVKNRFNSLIMKQKRLTPSIKKEQKLIRQLRTRFQERRIGIQRCRQKDNEIVGHKSEPSLSQDEDKAKGARLSIEERIQQKASSNRPKQQVKQQLISEYVVKQQSKAEGCQGEKLDRIEVQNPLSNYSPVMIPNCDLNFFIKEDNQEMKKNIFSEFPRYSPYSPYSPYIVSPNTPTNYIPSAPVFVSSQFYNYYNHFMSMTDLSQQESREGAPK